MDESPQEAASPETPKPEDSSKTVQASPKPESRPRRSGMRALRWVLGLLVVFGLGALLILFTLYIPTREKVSQTEADLAQANQKIADLQGQNSNLSSLDTKNQNLQTDLDRANLHVAILSARTDVAVAQLYLAKNDPSKARVALSQTPNTLKTLATLIDANQVKAVTDMENRLNQAVGEIDNNNYAAQSDLDVLSVSLTELENAYFTGP